MIAFSHVPVLADEVVRAFADVPPGTIADGTLGGGGHAGLLLDARADLDVLGIDRDPVARDAAAARLAGHRDRIRIVGGTAEDAMRAVAPGSLSGLLLDLGVSSPQIDDPDRGFSYRADGPLDMRMNPDAGPTAAELLAASDVETLAEQLRRFADEPNARRIARAVVAARPSTTAELADLVREHTPARDRRRGDPAKRTFQAVRILVNDELGGLARTLDAAVDAMVAGGRIVVISYHSGEDRIVKETFRRESDEWGGADRRLPPPPGVVARLELVGRGAVQPTTEEVARNPRAASARMRIARRRVT